MKTTYSKLINELLPQLQGIAQMQAQGMLVLPAKIGYAIGQNLTKIKPAVALYHKTRQELLEKYVRKDDKGKLAVITNEKKEQAYAYTDGGHEAFKTDINTWLETEVEWIAYRMQKDLLEMVDNFPVEAYGVLSEFDMISELALAGPRLVH